MKKILVIEDEPLFQKMIVYSLKKLEVEVFTAQDGEEGLDAARKNTPDLIISDVMMPKLDGYGVVRTLRREPRFAHTPILILTAQSDLNDKLLAFEAGADDFMTKPFEPAELNARVNNLLARGENLTKLKNQVQSQGIADARLIAVHSLRGGSGGSTLAVNLGVALVQSFSQPTLVLDQVLTAGQIALMLDLPLKRTWADIAAILPEELDWETLQTITIRHDSGLDCIAAPTLPIDAERLNTHHLTKALKLLRANYEYVIADLPHDFSSHTVEILDRADLILLMLAPEMASIRAGVAAIETYRQLGYAKSKIKLVLNKTFPDKGISSKKIEMVLKHPINLMIPHAPKTFVESINMGKPFMHSKSDGKLADHIRNFAKELF